VAVPVYYPFGGLAAAISIVVETARAKPPVLARMLADASADITRRLAMQSEQRLARTAHRRSGFAPVAPVLSGRVSAPA
jgi:hypothetical protein